LSVPGVASPGAAGYDFLGKQLRIGWRGGRMDWARIQLPSTRPRLIIKMPDPKDDPKSSEWRPYIFARDQWHCRICGDRFLYSATVRKHIANEHNETMPPSMYEYFHGAVWQRKKIP